MPAGGALTNDQLLIILLIVLNTAGVTSASNPFASPSPEPTTVVPAPESVDAYIASALAMQDDGKALAFAVTSSSSPR